MQDEALRALQAELGAPPPRGLADALDPDDLRRLATTVGEVRARQTRELEIASERALGKLPRILRGPVKLIVLRA